MGIRDRPVRHTRYTRRRNALLTASRSKASGLNDLYYIENTGTTTLRYLELWQSDHFADVSLRQWLAFTPYELVRAHLNIDKSVLEKVSTYKTPVVPA